MLQIKYVLTDFRIMQQSSEKALSVLKEWIELHGKPVKVLHDSGGEYIHLINSKTILDSIE